jgi:dTDP-4-dehydrorhamnose reductase
MIESEKYGTYHATNEGYCSWFELAKQAFSAAGLDMNVVPVTSDAFPSKIKRPENSRLDKSTLDNNGFSRLPHWTDAVQRYVAELKAQQ